MSFSTSRPTSEDTEEDLLRFQREFLASGSQAAVKVVKKRKSENIVPEEEVKAPENNGVENKDAEKMDVETKRELPKRVKFYDENKQTDHSIEEDVEKEMDAKDTHITAILSKIQERDTHDVPVMFPGKRTSAFPPVFHRITKQATSSGEGKQRKSIFAQQFAKRSLNEYGISSQTDAENAQTIQPCALKPLPRAIPMDRLQELYPVPGIISSAGLSVKPEESKKIHEENIQTLSAMSESEVLAEKQKLLRELDPRLVKFLQSRSKMQTSKEEMFLNDLARQNIEQSQSSGATDTNIEQSQSLGATDTKEVLLTEMKPPDIPHETPLEGIYPNMDVVETEKLAWMEMIPKTQRKEIKLSQRLNFDGDIITGDAEIPSHLGLHHHGQDPDLPGYTLQELFILSRSNFTQQRAFAVSLLGKIIAKAKCGRFLEIASEPILENLLQSGLLFLLRWSLDEQSETLLQASIFALHSLLSSQVEMVHDVVFSSDRGCEFPSLSPGVKIKDDDEDYDIAQNDVIAGLVKMKVLPRIRYILEVCKPGIVSVNQCLDILIRIARHSLQSAVRVYECPRLVQYIINKLIPSSWDKQASGDQSESSSSLPFPKAIRLLRSLCAAGRHLTSRLLNDFKDLKTAIVYKYINLSQDYTILNTEIELEAWKFWITFSSYGLHSEMFRDLFPIIIGLIQSLTSQLSDMQQISNDKMSFTLKRSLLIFKLCNTVVAACSEQTMPQWKEISDQIKLVAVLVADIVLRADKNINTNELHSVLATALDFFAKYCEELSLKSDISDKVCYSENLSKNVLSPILDCVKRCRFSDEINFCKTEKIASLPELATFEDQNFLVDFQFLSAYLRCCVAVCCLNKSLCSEFCSVVVYLADNCSWMLSNAENLSAFSLRCRAYCLYWAVNLFSLVSNIVTDFPQDLSQCANFYYLVAFRCFGHLGNGDEHMLHNLLSTVLFNPGLIRSVIDSTSSVTETMASLDVSKNLSEMTPDPKTITDFTLSSLPSVRATYLLSLAISPRVLEDSKQRFLHKNTEISSYLLKCDAHTATAPSDWPFIPLLQLYDQSISGELPGGSLKHITNSLHYLCFLEQHCKDCLISVVTTAKIVRLMCVFLAGNDMFLEPPVKRCLSFLFARYCNVKSQKELDFAQPIPGISSFYDFYLSLLEQYEGVSYGDELFSGVILLPLHQLDGGISDIKKALWCDRKELLRIISLPISKVLVPVSWYLMPVEIDVFMIRSYATALASGYCSQHRCPVLYLIAIHHTAEFLFNKQLDVSVARRKEIYRGVLKVEQPEIRKHILHYDGLDNNEDSKIGFRYTDALTDDRVNDINFLRG